MGTLEPTSPVVPPPGASEESPSKAVVQPSAYRKVLACAEIAAGMKGDKIVLLDIRAMAAFSDYFLLVNGASRAQVRAMASECDHHAKTGGWSRRGVEGLDHGWWVLVDLGDVVVHVFQPDARDFYDLENLWGDAKRVNIAGADPDAEPPKVEVRAVLPDDLSRHS